MSGKKVIAVFYGGRSPEHDVSVVTALQVMQALDPARFDVVPVYIDVQGEWLTGKPLRERKNYHPDQNIRKELTTVTLDMTSCGKGRLLPTKRAFFGGAKTIEFDVALLSFHGYGEDGRMQGIFETVGVPYTGMRLFASTVTMDKIGTKALLSSSGIPLLPTKAINKPKQGLLLAPDELAEATKDLQFPCCLKPCHMGSSIGVAKVHNPEELNAVLPRVFQYDTVAMVEPFVENLVEYNISVRSHDGKTLTSAIERPKCAEELLDFKQKYLSGGGTKGGTKGGVKTPGQSSEGMLSLTREINPKLDEQFEANIRKWASTAFEVLNGTGGPRIDFLCNGKTGEVWLNEVNPCPGSFAYFLWEAAQPSILFTELLSEQIDEALQIQAISQIPADPVPEDARLFKRQ